MDVTGEVVCLTGAGGYIGSALIKSLLSREPRALVLLDSSEANLFEARRKFGSGGEYVLGSVNDRPLLDAVFEHYRPRLVYHAAAYKHVGLLETMPFAAVQNNALGTETLVRAALAHGVTKVVLVSTDKAVHPRSVMGASKRIAERITLSFNGSTCRTSAIRLGNVLGSPGSVVPLLKEQLLADQPLSISHPDAARYFMTRDQAVGAILAAGVADVGGMVLLPEFEAPVQIVELARSLSKKASLCFTGLGPGEKLAEDLVGANETAVGKVEGPLQIIRTPLLSVNELKDARADLSACVSSRDRVRLLATLCRLVPEYRPSELMRASDTAL